MEEERVAVQGRLKNICRVRWVLPEGDAEQPIVPQPCASESLMRPYPQGPLKTNTSALEIALHAHFRISSENETRELESMTK